MPRRALRSAMGASEVTMRLSKKDGNPVLTMVIKSAVRNEAGVYHLADYLYRA